MTVKPVKYCLVAMNCGVRGFTTLEPALNPAMAVHCLLCLLPLSRQLSQPAHARCPSARRRRRRPRRTTRPLIDSPTFPPTNHRPQRNHSSFPSLPSILPSYSHSSHSRTIKTPCCCFPFPIPNS